MSLDSHGAWHLEEVEVDQATDSLVVFDRPEQLQNRDAQFGRHGDRIGCRELCSTVLQNV